MGGGGGGGGATAEEGVGGASDTPVEWISVQIKFMNQFLLTELNTSQTNRSFRRNYRSRRQVAPSSSGGGSFWAAS